MFYPEEIQEQMRIAYAALDEEIQAKTIPYDADPWMYMLTLYLEGPILTQMRDDRSWVVSDGKFVGEQVNETTEGPQRPIYVVEAEVKPEWVMTDGPQ